MQTKDSQIYTKHTQTFGKHCAGDGDDEHIQTFDIHPMIVCEEMAETIQIKSTQMRALTIK